MIPLDVWGGLHWKAKGCNCNFLGNFSKTGEKLFEIYDFNFPKSLDGARDGGKKSFALAKLRGRRMARAMREFLRIQLMLIYFLLFFLHRPSSQSLGSLGENESASCSNLLRRDALFLIKFSNFSVAKKELKIIFLALLPFLVQLASFSIFSLWYLWHFANFIFMLCKKSCAISLFGRKFIVWWIHKNAARLSSWYHWLFPSISRFPPQLVFSAITRTIYMPKVIKFNI